MDYIHDYTSSKPFYEKNINVLFPNKLGKFELINIIDNEKQSTGSGVSLGYTYCESNLTIYVYNKTIKSIENGIVSDIIINEMDCCIEDVYQMDKSGQKDKVSVCQPKDITYDVGKNKLSFRCAIANNLSKSEEMTTLLMLCGYRNNFIKIIYTTRKTMFLDTTEGEILYDGFMSNFCNIL